ncbi:TIGR02301 family protein [Methylosinus sp. Sm6]|uniref:TIGR02301 family protein n=1 Tax=Methylosinus sp. Sm6 TaxID=2866948 RepID=UPI001C9A0E3B|nr:TIGR02301 family protein [Methylosinus sp. Sm6]MBY6241771.1 TIGR02301 family protein [Methylosinus sp. Sm6]
MKRLSVCVLAVCLAVAGPARAQDFLSNLFGGWERPHAAPALPAERKAAAPPKAKKAKKAAKGAPPPALAGAPQPQPEGPPPPYEPQLLRLSEILGALSFLRDLCGDADGEEWRAKMASLLDAEAKAGQRRAKLTGAFNRGFHGYETTYRSCTANARSAIARYLDEGGRIAHDIAYRYGAS